MEPMHLKTVPCNACGQQIGRDAKACPHCGVDWPDGKPVQPQLSYVRAGLRKKTAYGVVRATLNAWLLLSFAGFGFALVAAFVQQSSPIVTIEMWPYIFASMVITFILTHVAHAILDIADSHLLGTPVKEIDHK